MNLQELLKKQMASAQALLDGVDASQGGIMTAEQVAEFDALTKQIESTKAQIAAREGFAAQIASLNAGVGRQTIPPDVTVGKTRIEDDPKCGFQNMADFAAAVKQVYHPAESAIDDRIRFLAAPSGQMIGRGSNEGIAMPSEFREAVISVMTGSETDFDVVSLLPPEPTSKNAVDILTDETTPWGTTGIQAYYAAEDAQLTASKIATAGATLPTHQCHVFVLAGENLLEDYARLSSRLTIGAGQALRYKTSESVFVGNGIGRPLGFTKAKSLISVAKDTNQTAKTVTADNILNMYSRIQNPNRGFWMINRDALPQIVKLTMNNGTTPVWSPLNEGFKFKPNGTILGLPFYISAFCETVGTKGDIYLIDPSGYLHIEKTGGVKFASSMHLYFDYNLEAFRYTYRHGGQPVLSSAISPKNGSSTTSHIVTLDARA